MDCEESDNPMIAACKAECSPLICPLYHHRGCGWKGPIENMMEHCLTNHASYTLKGFQQAFHVESYKRIKQRKDFVHVIQAHGNVFMLWLQKFPSEFLRVRLHSMGCCCDPKRYEAFITFQGYAEYRLSCYTADEYQSGFDRNDYNMLFVNSGHFSRMSTGLMYDILIKDKGLDYHLSRL